MAIKDVEIEKIVRVHGDDASLEIGTSADNPTWVELRNTNKESIEYYGKVSVLMPPNMAVALGKALMEYGMDLGGKLD